ncbi:MAG: FemAB family protein [Microgenomates group bacterium GW2011_GWA1_48_10]|uniref:BioF2-like acetyltransferase domain-containing protein n=1 Tax=Candidatus Gottesmanbacteria bacterium RIFCSPHIGHO2_01_FULL_47_48 TaxID=1798381 RepID=A0A1F5ZZL0_9BACT|nr:MAG: FemAB family protein [Microgenomates group bacterium GW2011_GWA1_48_10]OGG17785.1 MAG: hypothetical protein A2721_02070 [Candidatus Gottesmanbacteria bacterium RIFCSPHIGHO2_01_FULL_47_48]
MKVLGWQVKTAGRANVFIRHFPIFSYWSVIKVQRPEEVDFGKLGEIARKHHALFVKFEPSIILEDLSYLRNLGFEPDGWPLLSSKTLVLNLLTTTLESLSKDTRYEIRKAQQVLQGVGFASLKGHPFKGFVKRSYDIELFYSLLRETMKIGKWQVPIKKEVTSLWKSFQPNNAHLLIAYGAFHQPLQEDLLQKTLGGAFIIWEGDTAHYMYAALTREGRKMGAAYLLLWESIRYCKKLGLKYLDLEGIHDERFPKMTQNWQGFTTFKMGWGGKVVEYPGSYTKYYNPLVKLLFSFGDRF